MDEINEKLSILCNDKFCDLCKVPSIARVVNKSHEASYIAQIGLEQKYIKNINE
jgi:hypothetical protein